MDDGAVADRTAHANSQREARVGVEHRVLLQVGIAADDDQLTVAANDRPEPDADALAEFDLADDHGGRRDPVAAVSRQFG